MAEIALPGITTELWKGNALLPGGGTYVLIGTVIGLDSFGWEQEALEATHLTSTDMHYESVPGKMKSTAISGTLHWNHNDAGHELGVADSLLEKWSSGTTDAIRREKVAWQIRLPFDDIDAIPAATKATLSWNGFMTRFECSAPLDDAIVANFEIDVSGPVTYTAES